MSPTGSPVLPQAQRHHKKSRNVHKLLLNIKRRIIGDKKAGKMRDGLTIERFDGEMERGVNSTTHIVYRVALIKIPSYSGGKHCHWI